MTYSKITRQEIDAMTRVDGIAPNFIYEDYIIIRDKETEEIIEEYYVNLTIKKTADEVYEESLSPAPPKEDKMEVCLNEIEALKENDKSLLSSTFDLDFRLMEVEFVIDSAQPQAVNYKSIMRGSVNMAAMTPYEMARTLILTGAYERVDMEYKISVYVKRGRMTQSEADELIALMDANELVQ